MPCACVLPACTIPSDSQTTQVVLLICATGGRKDAPPPLRLCARRAFVQAIICIMFISWPLLVYAEAEAGFGSSLPYRKAERYSSRELSNEGLLLQDVTEQTSSAERISKLQNRKFLRQGTESEDDSTKELYPAALSEFSPEGILQLRSRNDKFPGRDSNPNRRMLIPASNVCTNKDISISQGPDGSSGIPRYLVQIVNTCMSDCAPSQVHVTCDECTNKDISITQRRDGSPGMPRFSVQIVNTCVSDCAPADIHVFCGWFASSPPPNPNTFQRLSYNDCLVNGGRPLGHGAIIQFQYANSFMYPIRFRSATFCR